jgi:hypothetical protein
MTGNNSMKNLQHDGVASTDVPEYNELCAGADDRRDESSVSKLDDEDQNDSQGLSYANTGLCTRL